MMAVPLSKTSARIRRTGVERCPRECEVTRCRRKSSLQPSIERGRMMESAPAAKRLPPIRAADLSSQIHVMNTALLGSVLAAVRSASVVA